MESCSFSSIGNLLFQPGLEQFLGGEKKDNTKAETAVEGYKKYGVKTERKEEK